MNFIERCEINVTRHCNNHCLACNHGSPLADPYYMDAATLQRDLIAFGKVCRIGFLCLQGGEPLLHPKILELMDVQGKYGNADRFGMLTNGRLLDKMPDEFYKKAGQLNYELRVSVYENLDPKAVEYGMAKSRQYGVDIRPGPIQAFWKLFYEQPDGGSAIWKTCFAASCYTLHEGYFFHCPLAAFFPAQFFGKEFGVSGLPLSGITNDKLKAFLEQKEPDWMCAHCTGGSQKQVLWREEYNREIWKKESTHE